MLGLLPMSAYGAIECLATDSLAQQRWAEAERILRENLGRQACLTERMLTFTLARTVHQLARAAPARSCEARDLYDQAIETMPSGTAKAVAVKAREGVDAICRCLPPQRLLTEARWSEAEVRLDERIADSACVASRDSLELARAQVIEKQVGDAPRRACEAEALFGGLATTAEGPALIEAQAGERRMQLICRALVEDCARPGDEDVDGLADCADPACAEHPACAAPTEDDTAVWLGIGAGVAAVAGGALYGIGYYHDGLRMDAHAAILDAQEIPDATAEERARGRFDDALARAQLFGISGIAVLAGAAGLTLAALLHDPSDEVVPSVGRDGATLRISF